LPKKFYTIGHREEDSWIQNQFQLLEEAFWDLSYKYFSASIVIKSYCVSHNNINGWGREVFLKGKVQYS
jgi:hypothetical protein